MECTKWRLRGHSNEVFLASFCVPPAAPPAAVSLSVPSGQHGAQGGPVLLRDVQRHELQGLRALHQPALALADPRHVHLQELVGHPAPQDVRQELHVQARRALRHGVPVLALEQPGRQRHHVLGGGRGRGLVRLWGAATRVLPGTGAVQARDTTRRSPERTSGENAAGAGVGPGRPTRPAPRECQRNQGRPATGVSSPSWPAGARGKSAATPSATHPESEVIPISPCPLSPTRP